MEKQIIELKIGEITIFRKNTHLKEIPIIFLHGVYLDHKLWDKQTLEINDRPIIVIDMPMHGESKKNIKEDWDLDDCTDMLLEILDILKINQVIAIGHSWGSMTIFRAVIKNPKRFISLGLFNMPFKKISKKEKLKIMFQHTALIFRNLYMKQAGKALIGSKSLLANPNLINNLIIPMKKLTNKEIRYIDKVVRIEAEDTTEIIKTLTIPNIALLGEEDYVGTPPIGEVITVKGGHLSPLETPDEVNYLIRRLILGIYKN